jgi:hypothetical protein
VKVGKTKNDILLTCSLPGYQEPNVNLESGYGAGSRDGCSDTNCRYFSESAQLVLSRRALGTAASSGA